MPIPRIITVDPTWTIARIVRSALDLIDRPVIQVDVPGGAEALAELSRGCTLLITNFEVDENMRGFELAMRVKRESQDTSVIVLGDVGDPEEFDQETAAESPYAYLCRPFDLQKFLRVLLAGIEGSGRMYEALFPPVTAAPVFNNDMGPVPQMDVTAAQTIVDQFQRDVGAMAVLLASRAGDVLLERGAVGLMNREKLTATMIPAVLTNIEAKDMLGGQLSSIQFYDGESFDVFVLTVGLHHFMCAIFDGQQGSRQFGAVNRFGRRAVEDLIALIGANAFFIQKVAPAPVEDTRITPRKKVAKIRETEEVELVEIARADFGHVEAPQPVPEPELKLEAIPDDAFNLDDIFGKEPADLNGDELFNLEDLEQIANQNLQNSKGKLDWDTAKTIGLIPD
jgi:DNA-binding response OmpR family regulator